MKMKCIGGLANGRVIEVESYYGEHDIVRVNSTIDFKIDNFEESLLAFREGRTPESMVVPYLYYKIATIYTSKHHKLNFLIPEKWSTEEALQYQLGA